MAGWTGRPDKPLPFKPTTINRASKRTGQRLTNNTWQVNGDTKLGDAYPDYTVEQTGRTYTCTCTEHEHGEHRHFCTHRVWVILAKRGETPYEDRRETAGPSGMPDRQAPVHDPPDQEQQADVPSGDGPLRPLSEAFPDPYLSKPLPVWVHTLRTGQREIAERITVLFTNHKVVFLDAPTGAGKTLIAELTRRLWSKPHTVYTCTTKTLQQQVLTDYPYARLLKGRGNYPVTQFPNAYPEITAELCDGTRADNNCTLCFDMGRCPYWIAKRAAAAHPLAVLNTSYLLAETSTEHSEFAGTPLVVIDEADLLESELMRHIQISLSSRVMRDLGISPPERKTVASTWDTWIRDIALPALDRRLNAFSPFRDLPPNHRRQYLRYQRLRDQLRQVSMGQLEDGWVYTGYDQGAVVFKPIMVDWWAAKNLWRKADRWLLMSATIISAEQMALDLGLEPGEWAEVSMPSSFDPGRRPVYIEPVAAMTAKNKTEAYPVMGRNVKDIVERYPNERILVHTVNYELVGHLDGVVRHTGRAITYTSAAERQDALDRFLASDDGVLLAPSFDRGIDLAGDQCRVVIVAKIPYPYLGDKQVSARLHAKGGQGWYDMMTVRTLVQMCGRAMRSEDDWCEVFVLDSMFPRAIWKKRHLIPGWLREAVKTEGSGRKRV